MYALKCLHPNGDLEIQHYDKSTRRLTMYMTQEFNYYKREAEKNHTLKAVRSDSNSAGVYYTDGTSIRWIISHWTPQYDERGDFIYFFPAD